MDVIEAQVTSGSNVIEKPSTDEVSRSTTEAMEATDSLTQPAVLPSTPTGPDPTDWRPTLRQPEQPQANRPTIPGRRRPIWNSDVINTIEVIADRFIRENTPNEQ